MRKGAVTTFLWIIAYLSSAAVQSGMFHLCMAAFLWFIANLSAAQADNS